MYKYWRRLFTKPTMPPPAVHTMIKMFGITIQQHKHKHGMFEMQTPHSMHATTIRSLLPYHSQNVTASLQQVSFQPQIPCRNAAGTHTCMHASSSSSHLHHPGRRWLQGRGPQRGRASPRWAAWRSQGSHLHVCMGTCS